MGFLSSSYSPPSYSPPPPYSPPSYSLPPYSPPPYTPSSYTPSSYSPKSCAPSSYTPSSYSPPSTRPNAYNPSSSTSDLYNPLSLNPLNPASILSPFYWGNDDTVYIEETQESPVVPETCTLSEHSFVLVGQAPISGLPEPWSGLSLVKGIGNRGADLQISDMPEDDLESFYYLGSPESTDIFSLSGCIVFFPNAKNDLGSGKALSDEFFETDTDSCEGVVHQGCIEVLEKTLKKVTEEPLSCSTLQNELSKTSIKTCRKVLGLGKGRGAFFVVDMADMKPVKTDTTGSQLGCRELISDGTQLARIPTGDKIAAKHAAGDKGTITPVLTVFGGKGMNESSIQLSCVKANKAQTSGASATGVSLSYPVLGLITLATSSLLLGI